MRGRHILVLGALAVIALLPLSLIVVRIKLNQQHITQADARARAAVVRVTAIQEARRIVAVAYAKSDLRLCRQIEVLKATISTVIRKNAPSARIVYYQEHPTELKAARLKSLAALKQFRPRRCSTLPSQKQAVIIKRS